MSTKFTNDQWIVSPIESQNRDGDIVSFAIDGGDRHIAEVHIDIRDNGNEVGLANAHLIAASPKMHKALEIAEEALNNIDGDLLSRSANMEIHEALKAIHEALLKARGES